MFSFAFLRACTLVCSEAESLFILVRDVRAFEKKYAKDVLALVKDLGFTGPEKEPRRIPQRGCIPFDPMTITPGKMASKPMCCVLFRVKRPAGFWSFFALKIAKHFCAGGGESGKVSSFRDCLHGWMKTNREEQGIEELLSFYSCVFSAHIFDESPRG